MVQDDIIEATNGVFQLVESPLDNYVLTFILDSSGSVGNSNWSKTCNAVDDMLAEFQRTNPDGNYDISVVMLGRSYRVVGDNYKLTDQVISDIRGLGYGSNINTGNTNYYDTLNKAADLINSDLGTYNIGKDVGDYNYKVYFISDGKPNTGSSGGKDIPRAWSDLVNEPNVILIDAYTIGVGSSIDVGTLKTVLGSDQGQAGGDRYIKINDYKNLAETMEQLVATGKGDVIDKTGIIDADTDYTLTSITFDGTVYEFAKLPEGKEYYLFVLEKTSDNKEFIVLQVFKDGSYNVNVYGSLPGNSYFNDKISFTISDVDGDSTVVTGVEIFTRESYFAPIGDVNPVLNESHLPSGTDEGCGVLHGELAFAVGLHSYDLKHFVIGGKTVTVDGDGSLVIDPDNPIILGSVVITGGTFVSTDEIGNAKLTLQYELTEPMQHNGADQAVFPLSDIQIVTEDGTSKVGGSITVVDDQPENIGQNGIFHNAKDTVLHGLLVDMGADGDRAHSVPRQQRRKERLV